MTGKEFGGDPRGADRVNTTNRRVDLQGMRALAVWMVFADHLFGWPRGGFVGVDVFFVLSGFFITQLLIRRRTTDGRISFRDFYVHRVKRILPSAFLVLTATVFSSYLLFPAFRAKETLVDALYAAIFGANIRFEFTGADYFQRGQPPSPLQHFWSLSIEEQFYFVWPALLVLIFSLTRTFRRAGKPWMRQGILLGSMTLIVTGSFGYAMFLSADDPNGAYFSSFGRVWELGVGAMLAIAGPWLTRVPSSFRPVLAYCGLAGVVASVFVVNSTVRFPAPWALLPVMATAVVVASFHGAEVRNMIVLTNPVTRYFGDVSYTLYLWHWPVIILLQSVMSEGLYFFAIALIASLGLTAITYRFYESPIRQSNWLLGEQALVDRRIPSLTPSVWGGISVLAAMSIFVAICGIHYNDRTSAISEEVARVGRQASSVDAGSSENGPANPCFGATAMVTDGCVLRNPEAALEPSIDNFADDQLSLSNCNMWSDHDRTCTYGYLGDDAIRIALVGDSHAEAFLPALIPSLKANKWRLTAYVGHQCILSKLPVGACDAALTKVDEALLAHPYDLVIVANYDEGIEAQRYREVWERIVQAGSKIVVIRDNPTTTAEALSCLTRVSFSGDRTGECGASRTEAFPRTETLASAASLVPGVTLLDLTPYYCTIDRCPSVIGNVIVYRDIMDGTNSHITATFAETLAPAVEEGLRGALGQHHS